MKKLFLTITIIIAAVITKGQNVAISNTGAAPDPSAMLDIISTVKGMLIPRTTTYRRNNDIVNPAEGLLVFDTDTKTFWYYYQSGWKEIPNNSIGANPSGNASGDLYGNYPSPNVGKIQNLDVASGVPFDKQILKWDALNNTWKGLNDSLFLPYNVTFGSPTILFGITNANTTIGATAIYGKSGAGSGGSIGSTTGVWGDNSTGIGVGGTSYSNLGVYGSSEEFNGIHGYSNAANYAGVKGESGAINGIGLLGEIGNTGIAVYGKSSGVNGKAATFENTYSLNADTAVKIVQKGTGKGISVSLTNTANAEDGISVLATGTGKGIKISSTNASSLADGINISVSGTGNGIFSKSNKGTAGQFENTNFSNTNPVVHINNAGGSAALKIDGTPLSLTEPVVNIINKGSTVGLDVSSTTTGGNNVVFTTTNAGNIQPNLLVEHNGAGRGIEVKLTGAGNNNAGLYINTAGNKGAEIISAGSIGVAATTSGNNAVAVSGNTGQTANNAVGVKGVTGANVTGGIGVLGIAGINDPTGIGVKGTAGGGNAGGIGVLGEGSSANPQAIGVKGTSYTHNEDVGAVTGINFTDGVGVYGEATGADGIGVAATVGNTGNHSVAGVFTNNYTNNNRAVVELKSNGKGNAIYSENTNLTNSSPMLRITNAGTGEFLKFENNLAVNITTIAKNGDIKTDGTVTVKDNKGIIRNSTGTQLRMESLQTTIGSGTINHFDPGGFNGAVTIPVTYTSVFSAAPVVYIANTVTEGGIIRLSISIQNVTTTGFNIVIVNNTNHDINYSVSAIKTVAIGPE